MYKLFYVNKNKILYLLDYFIIILLILSLSFFTLKKIEIFKYLITTTTFIYIIKFIFENKTELKNRTKNYLNKIILNKNKKNIYIFTKKINFTYIFILIITLSFFISYFFKLELFKELVILFLLIGYETTNIIDIVTLNYLIKNLDNIDKIDNLVENNKLYKIINIKTLRYLENDIYQIEKTKCLIHDKYINRNELLKLFNNYK